MIQATQIETSGWKAALRGMRNPMNSWDKADSIIDTSHLIIGENDLKLMKTLGRQSDDHAKFLRMINVTMDILAPLYWWKEFDTYKIGTVADSCSTMHKIQAKEFDMGDFSTEHLDESSKIFMTTLISTLNYNRKLYNATNDKHYWWQMIQLLPTSFNQLRTVQMNYQVALRMIRARKIHKLDEWRDFCKTLIDLPYIKLFLSTEVEE